MKTIYHYTLMLATLATVGTATTSNAQTSVPSENPTPFSKASSFRTWSVGVNGGLLAPVVITGGKNDFTNWEIGAGYGGFIKKQLWHNFALQGNFFRGTLKADNDEELGNGAIPSSAVSGYETEVKWGADLSALYNIGNFSILNRQSYISPYISAGLGLMGYQPEVMMGGTTVDYNNGENIHELYVPVGVGAKFMVSKGINIDLGYKMNFVDGDNLDGLHNAPQNDKFSYTYAGLEFALGNSNKPQLQFTNPAAVLEAGYQARYDDLKAQMDAEKQDLLNQKQDMADKLAKLTADADGDGVSDYFDKCPNTPADTKVDGSGCALPEAKAPVTYVITEEDKKVVNEAIKNLEFDFNKASIRSSSYPSLNRVAELLTTKNLSLKLAGHTDNVGSDAYNLKLSKERAESVKTYLVSQGANPSRIEATGYGETQPIESNSTEQGRQNNRRVEFTIFN